ncbi:hypothetical protein LEMLEM_LOCUS1939 [Lemmus lemmus]
MPKLFMLTAFHVCTYYIHTTTCLYIFLITCVCVCTGMHATVHFCRGKVVLIILLTCVCVYRNACHSAFLQREGCPDHLAYVCVCVCVCVYRNACHSAFLQREGYPDHLASTYQVLRLRAYPIKAGFTQF